MPFPAVVVSGVLVGACVCIPVYSFTTGKAEKGEQPPKRQSGEGLEASTIIRMAVGW